MSKMLRKVDEDNEGTNQVSMSEWEWEPIEHKECRKTQWHHEKNTNNKSSEIFG